MQHTNKLVFYAGINWIGHIVPAVIVPHAPLRGIPDRGRTARIRDIVVEGIIVDRALAHVEHVDALARVIEDGIVAALDDEAVAPEDAVVATIDESKCLQ